MCVLHDSDICDVFTECAAQSGRRKACRWQGAHQCGGQQKPYARTTNQYVQSCAHLLTETSTSLAFSACLRGWSSSPRNFASSSEMKFSDAPVSASACTQCSQIRVLKKKLSQRRLVRVTSTGSTQLSTGHTVTKYALITRASFTKVDGRDTDKRFFWCTVNGCLAQLFGCGAQAHTTRHRRGGRRR